MDRSEKYSLLLLAGGKSSRMGCNKAELLYQGKTFTEILVSKVRKLGIQKIYISGFQKEIENVHIVWDWYPDRGPLGGIHACMEEMETPYCLVLPVDVPQIPLDVLETLLSRHEEEEVPFLLEHGDRKEYLIGIYPVRMKNVIEERIKGRSASVHGLLEDWGCEYCRLDIPDGQVSNVNTPKAYKELLENERKG